MKIILSPAKKMQTDTDTLSARQDLIFPEKTGEILREMRSRSFEELKELWGCSEKIARQSYEQLQMIGSEALRTPALLAYEGIAYQYMAPSVFSDGEFSYLQQHLRILSALYGVLRPMDGVHPYRLEMQAKLAVGGKKDLYEFWGREIFEAVCDEERLIINLASKEYAGIVERYLGKEDRFISCVFYEDTGSKPVQKSVYAKMARGEMVRYMAEHRIENPEELKAFDRMGYRFLEERSSEREYFFVRSEEKNEKHKKRRPFEK